MAQKQASKTYDEVKSTTTEGAAPVGRIVPLIRKKNSAHEFAFAILGSGIAKASSAEVGFKRKNTTGAVVFFPATARTVKTTGEDVVVVIAKVKSITALKMAFVGDEGGVGDVTVTVIDEDGKTYPITQGDGAHGDPVP